MGGDAVTTRGHDRGLQRRATRLERRVLVLRARRRARHLVVRNRLRDRPLRQGAGSRRSATRRRVTAPTVRRIPGESGTWVFLFGDMLVFGVFFVTFMVERAKAPQVFDVARTTLHVGVGATNTLVLLTSSLCVVVALGAIRSGMKSMATKALYA